MKKFLLISSVIMILVLLFSFTQAFIMTAEAKVDATPGAKATEKAIEKAAKGAEEGENGKGGPKQNFKGTINSISTGSLVLTLADETNVTIFVDTNTNVKIPGMGKSTGLSALEKGMNVAVQATTGADNKLVARQIHLVPGKPTKLHRVGTVSNYQAGKSLTVTGSDGQSTTFTINQDTKILPKDRLDLLHDGAFVTVICPRSVSGVDPVAKGIVVHPEGTSPGQPDKSEPAEEPTSG